MAGITVSKTEKKPVFYPVHLSAILNPTYYKSPFTNLEKFQVDTGMDSFSKFPPPQETTWQKLQSSLLRTVSKLAVKSSTSALTSNLPPKNGMSLVPYWKPKHCEPLTSEESSEGRDYLPTSLSSSSSAEGTKSSKSSTPNNDSQLLFHSVRVGLQTIRRLATHSLHLGDNENEWEWSTQKQSTTFANHYSPELSVSGGHPIPCGGAYYPSINSYDNANGSIFSVSTSPSFAAPHNHFSESLEPAVSKLFWWTMSGYLITALLHYRHFNEFYKNYSLPVQTPSAMLTCSVTPSKIQDLTSPHYKNEVSASIDIVLHSSSTAPSPSSESSQDTSSKNKNVEINCSKSASTSSPSTKFIKVSNTQASIHTVSICSSSSTLKGGACTIAPKFSMSSSPRDILSVRTTSRRFHSESECSTSSFVEFAASLESNDSLCIVFESGADECIGGEEYDDEEWEKMDDDEGGSEEDDDDDDQSSNYSSESDDIFVDGFMFHVEGIDGIDVEDSPTSTHQVDFCMNRRRKKRKRVSFDEENLESIVEFEDDADSKSSREKYWEFIALDRGRFKCRVSSTADILDPILLPGHRLNIFQQRFQNMEEHSPA